MTSVSQIIEAIGMAAPLPAQEQWDNSGLLVDCNTGRECTGVMLCLDVTPAVVEQAMERGCNLIVGHHPVIFKGIKSLNSNTLQGDALMTCVKNDISVYCAHTSLDNAPEQWNVSAEMARMLGFSIISPITASGTGVFCETERGLSAGELCTLCRDAFTAKGLRHSVASGGYIRKVAVGSGACGFLIPDAIAAGADAIITADVRYHDFLDFGNEIFIVDLTHFDTEKCTKEIFKRIISQNFPNFAHVFCARETNPIAYL